MVITVRPADASGALLPVQCIVTLRREGSPARTAPCPPGTQAVFENLVAHAVYRITVEADGFRASAAAVLAAADHTEEVRCVLRIADCCLDVPAVERLPADLLRILATYAPEAPPREMRVRDLGTRTLPCTCPSDRTLPGRDLAKGPLTPPAWAALTAEQRSGLLNLYAKMRSISVGEGRSVWSYVERLVGVHQDRIFVEVKSSLAFDARKMLDVFKDADDSLHEPGAGYRRAGSVKSREPHGNLQLSFSVPTAAAGPTHVDADVDEAAGLGHVGQVLRNWLTGDATHPFDVHQILVKHQRATHQAMRAIDAYRPCYRLGRRAGPAGYRLPATPPQ